MMASDEPSTSVGRVPTLLDVSAKALAKELSLAWSTGNDAEVAKLGSLSPHVLTRFGQILLRELVAYDTSLAVHVMKEYPVLRRFKDELLGLLNAALSSSFSNSITERMRRAGLYDVEFAVVPSAPRDVIATWVLPEHEPKPYNPDDSLPSVRACAIRHIETLLSDASDDNPAKCPPSVQWLFDNPCMSLPSMSDSVDVLSSGGAAVSDDAVVIGTLCRNDVPADLTRLSGLSVPDQDGPRITKVDLINVQFDPHLPLWLTALSDLDEMQFSASVLQTPECFDRLLPVARHIKSLCVIGAKFLSLPYLLIEFVQQTRPHHLFVDSATYYGIKRMSECVDHLEIGTFTSQFYDWAPLREDDRNHTLKRLTIGLAHTFDVLAFFHFTGLESLTVTSAPTFTPIAWVHERSQLNTFFIPGKVRVYRGDFGVLPDEEYAAALLVVSLYYSRNTLECVDLSGITSIPATLYIKFLVNFVKSHRPPRLRVVRVSVDTASEKDIELFLRPDAYEPFTVLATGTRANRFIFELRYSAHATTDVSSALSVLRL